MRRALALAALLSFAAGCASAPPTATTNNTTGPTGALSANATITTPPPPVSDRGDLVTEKFILRPDHSFAIAFPEDPTTPPAASVAETFTGSAFFTSTDPASVLPPWEGPVAQRTFEITRDVTIVVKFS